MCVAKHRSDDSSLNTSICENDGERTPDLFKKEETVVSRSIKK